jgi:hypothetical protein
MHWKLMEMTAAGKETNNLKEKWGLLGPVRLAYEPSASSTFLSHQTSHQQPVSSTLLSEQTSTSQPNRLLD